MKDEVITPEERALGAFLSAMYDQRLDGTKMREAMLKVLGIAAPKALEPLTLLSAAFRTTVAHGLNEDYCMVFKFKDLDSLHAADDEWRKFRGAP